METYYPLVILAVGIAAVLGMILILRLNAFLALISAAILVSLMSPGEVAGKIGRVATEFGKTAGNIGVVIAMAAIIGACLMESGAADRIVRAFLRVLGEKRASTALMGSGFVLAIPVFFDTVFYLLVPLARSLHRRTGTHYLKYVLAIGCGGAITHTLVPPTPGPLLVADLLGVDKGMMILVGLVVALPSAIAGLAFCAWADRVMPTPMRPISGSTEATPPPDDALPPLGLAILPVLLPVLLISINTALSSYADAERAARVRPAEVLDADGLAEALRIEFLEGTPGARLRDLLPDGALNDPDAEELAEAINTNVLPERRDGLAPAAGDLSRKTKAEVEHLNRLALEEIVPESDLTRHHWETPRRKAANWASLFGDPNLALLLAAAIAMGLVIRQRKSGLGELAKLVEQSLMSAGVIILITSSGGAFGGMLREAGIGGVIEGSFGGEGEAGASGLVLMLVGFGVSAVLKVAQGSSTVAMITASGIMAALVTSPSVLGYHPAYLATAIGSGSLIGSWMNDSGFWVFAKMSGLTETEALKSWTPLLLILGIVGLVVSLLLALALPMTTLA